MRRDRANPCRECFQRQMDDLYDEHLAELQRRRDPRNDPTYQDATDAEWWEWILVSNECD